MRSRHFFERLRRSEVPEPTPAPDIIFFLALINLVINKNLFGIIFVFLNKTDFMFITRTKLFNLVFLKEKPAGASSRFRPTKKSAPAPPYKWQLRLRNTGPLITRGRDDQPLAMRSRMTPSRLVISEVQWSRKYRRGESKTKNKNKY